MKGNLCILIAGVMLMMLTTTVPAVAQTRTFDLRPQFEEGRTARYSVWTVRRQDITLAIGDQRRAVSIQYEVDGEMTWKVDSVNDDGSATCTMTYDWLTFTLTNSEGTKQVNDSRRSSGDSEAIHDVITSVAGQPLQVQMNADGSARSISGVDAVRARADDPDRMPEERDFLETASDLATVPFVPDAVVLKDTWHAKFSWGHEMGTLHHDTTFTFTGIESLAGIPIASVRGEGKLKLEPDYSKVPKDAPKMTVTLEDGKVQHQILMDLVRHEAVGRNVMQQLVIRIETEGSELTRIMKETIQSQAMRIEEE
jgi:hypothetical protein